MPVVGADAGDLPYALPPVRLRTVFAGLIALGALCSLYPRAVAAWEVHEHATQLADYALCMAGPTGPSLLRDHSSAFKSVVRRRLLAAGPDERVFERCAAAGAQVLESERAHKAFAAPASEFVEYGGPAADRAQAGSSKELSLDLLDVSTRALAELTRDAWPFVRGGYTRLMRPSIGAREAIHPVALPKPAVGHGLPVWPALYRAVHRTGSGYWVAFGRGSSLSVYRSDEAGLVWKPASVRHPLVESFAERCSAGGNRSFTFDTSDDERFVVVRAHEAGAPSLTMPLAPTGAKIVSAACDEDTLIAALQPKDKAPLGLWACRYGASCSELRLPDFGSLTANVLPKLDLARVDGVTIVAVPMHGVVRVTSSRDDGKSWTPPAVAFDIEAHPEVRTQVALPARLLALGKRVFLYGGASKPSMTYPVLVSDDYGASFRTPAPSAPAAAGSAATAGLQRP